MRVSCAVISVVVSGRMPAAAASAPYSEPGESTNGEKYTMSPAVSGMALSAAMVALSCAAAPVSPPMPVMMITLAAIPACLMRRTASITSAAVPGLRRNRSSASSPVSMPM